MEAVEMLQDGELDIASLGSSSHAVHCDVYYKLRVCCRSAPIATALMTPYNLDAEVILVEYVCSGLMAMLTWLCSHVLGSTQLGSNEALIVRPEIITPADLPGKTIATSQGSTSHYQLLYFLKLLNLDKVVTVRIAGPSEFAELWQTGAIDGVFVWSPYLQALRTTFDAHTLITSSALGDLGAPIADMYVAHIATSYH